MIPPIGRRGKPLGVGASPDGAYKARGAAVDAVRYVDFFFLVVGFLAAFFGALAFLPLRV
jgi:hypothetical protein